ncbi:alpha/beta hydrolase [soil metagenome]
MGVAKLAVIAGLGLALLAGGPLLLRAALQWRVSANLAITSPEGIQDSSFVPIGGHPQWVQVRGEHRTNPVILVVHGGPGFAMSPLTPVFRAWETDFTVVQWDQRDAGLTYSRNGAQPISLGQVAGDGVEVAEYLRRKLPDAPIILLGHSWGSAVGLEMIRRRPDLFAAFVGAGQMSSKTEQEEISYRLVLDRLRAAGNQKGVAELSRTGPPPYKDLAGLLVERKWLSVVDTPQERSLFRRMAPLVLTAPGMSLTDVRAYLAAPKVAQSASFDEISTFEARKLGVRFETPIFVFAGDQDLYTPVGPTERYLAEIDAPMKSLVILRGGGHDALLTMPDRFLAELRARVRPLVMGPRGLSPSTRSK